MFLPHQPPLAIINTSLAPTSQYFQSISEFQFLLQQRNTLVNGKKTKFDQLIWTLTRYQPQIHKCLTFSKTNAKCLTKLRAFSCFFQIRNLVVPSLSLFREVLPRQKCSALFRRGEGSREGVHVLYDNDNNDVNCIFFIFYERNNCKKISQ